MPEKGRQSRPRRADPHVRRRPVRRRRLSWLVFWLRGNRRTSEGAVAAAQDAGDTLRAGEGAAAAPPTAAWPLGQVLLRLLGALAVAALVFSVGVGGFHLLRRSSHFALRSIRVSPTVHVSREALIARAGLSEGENLFRIDLARAGRDLAAEPWLRRVRVRRELPDAVAIDAEEYEPRALVALGTLYLSDGDGVIFKRATPEEARGLPVVTGIGREAYLADRAESQALIREALAAVAAFRAEGRPPIGEVHVDLFAGLTLYTASGVAIRLGPGEAAPSPERLGRFDAVWAELGRRGDRPAVVFLDNRAHEDHVTVRLEAPAAGRGGGATRGASGTPQ